MLNATSYRVFFFIYIYSDNAKYAGNAFDIVSLSVLIITLEFLRQTKEI